MRRLFFYPALLCYWIIVPVSQAENDAENYDPDHSDLSQCLQATVTGASRTVTVEELIKNCERQLQEASPASEASPTSNEEQPLLEQRLRLEALNRTNRFVLTPHRRNYFLAASYNPEPNPAPYEGVDPSLTELQHAEIEFQISVKILIREAIFGDNGHLYAAYTNHSFWQAYNKETSRPFRETNHQPEFILSFTNDWTILGFRNVLNEAMINHQSNGQSGDLSRSWNRIMFHSVFERGPLAISFRPWMRIPERDKRDADDPGGDDNPDIEKYLGNFELSAAWQRKEHIISVMVRNNLRSHNRGAVELGWTFPVSSTTRGYIKYFNGYGLSLIDHDINSNVLGLGIVFTDLF